MEHYRSATVIIMTAAVADFRCKDENCQKIRRRVTATSDLELEKNPDIIGELGKVKEERIIVGFAAETENIFDNAREKLKKKNLDLIVANNVAKAGMGLVRIEMKWLSSNDRGA